MLLYLPVVLFAFVYNLTEDGNFMAGKLFASPCFVWLFVRLCVFVMFPVKSFG